MKSLLSLLNIKNTININQPLDDGLNYLKLVKRETMMLVFLPLKKIIVEHRVDNVSRVGHIALNQLQQWTNVEYEENMVWGIYSVLQYRSLLPASTEWNIQQNTMADPTLFLSQHHLNSTQQNYNYIFRKKSNNTSQCKSVIKICSKSQHCPCWG